MLSAWHLRKDTQMHNSILRTVGKVIFVGASVALTLVILFVIAVIIAFAQGGFQIG